MYTSFEVIVIGGSYAGLSGAMALGRASRKTLVIDSGKPCNRNTPHSHNFITQDGEIPAIIAAKAKEQVAQYPTVTFVEDHAIYGEKSASGFIITTASGKVYESKKLLFSTGITDLFPPIKGIEACWAKTVIHCPYCHGYEVKNQKTAILANGEAAVHYAKLLLQWTKKLTIFTNGTPNFTNEDYDGFKKHNIDIIETELAELIHANGKLQKILLNDGRILHFDVMYYKPAFKMHCDIPIKLGVVVNETGYFNVDFMQKTSVSGVFAAGDCTGPMRSVANAVAEGSKAGAMINNELAIEAY